MAYTNKMFVEQTVACMRIAGYDDDAITGFSQKNTEQQKKIGHFKFQ